jgi:hypothetical protein
MALKKSLETNTGVSASYWKISQIELFKDNRSAVVTLLGYLDKDVRLDSTKTYIDRRVFEFQDFDVTSNVWAQTYSRIKESKKVLVSEAVSAVLDEQGNVVTQAVEAVYAETNEFVDAEDC